VEDLMAGQEHYQNPLVVEEYFQIPSEEGAKEYLIQGEEVVRELLHFLFRVN